MRKKGTLEGDIYYCQGTRNKSYHKEDFCFDDDGLTGWGCRKIESIRKNISAYYIDYWYRIGKFISMTKW